MNRACLADPRAVAWKVLISVEQGAFADAELGRCLATARLETHDRTLATRLVYGTLAWQGLLDHALAPLVRRDSGGNLDLPVRALLRLALFQLVKLGRVPDFAAVDTAVELSKQFRGGAASGLVNAVLRRFLREGGAIDLPPRDAGLAAHLAVKLSHPGWLVERWLAEFGASETEALLAANNEAAPTVLRVNRRCGGAESLSERLRRAGVKVRPGVWSPDALLLESPTAPNSLPDWAEGCCTLQGEASQLVSNLLGAVDGDRILDACAAPGGKATQIAERLGGSGRVTAVDRNARGLGRLRDAARRLGLGGLSIACADARRLPFAAGTSFDRVLLDAPCSGLGTLRQHPEIKWRRSPESIAGLADLQRRLLDAVATVVRPGGTLVYATCTISRVENEDVVETFLERHPEFRCDDPRRFLPLGARQLVGDDCAFRSFPHHHGLDGFFAVRLERL